MSNQQISVIGYSPQRARAGGHDPVIRAVPVKSAQGTLPGGLILGQDSDEKAVPYVQAETAMGTGDGTDKTFAGVLPHPVEPGTVIVSDGVETFSDDGFGHLTGSAGGTGSVNYLSGAVSVAFNAAPANAAPVEAQSYPRLAGVLDETVDTSKSASALVIVHGSVQMSMLKVGATAPADPSAAMLKRLVKTGIYPV